MNFIEIIFDPGKTARPKVGDQYFLNDPTLSNAICLVLVSESNYTVDATGWATSAFYCKIQLRLA